MVLLVRFQNCVGRFAPAAPDAAASAARMRGKCNRRFMIESMSSKENRALVEPQKSARSDPLRVARLPKPVTDEVFPNSPGTFGNLRSRALRGGVHSCPWTAATKDQFARQTGLKRAKNILSPLSSTDRVFIRSRSRSSNKTLLFLLAALTLHRAVVR